MKAVGVVRADHSVGCACHLIANAFGATYVPMQ